MGRIALLGGGIAALVGVVIAIGAIAGGGSKATLANFPTVGATPNFTPPFASATPTTGPAQPTKIPATGDLSGTVDILVPGPIAGAPIILPNKAVGLFHCIAQLTHDSSGGPGVQPLNIAAQCVADREIGDVSSQLFGRNVPGEGVDGRPGPPPPPPYNTGKPAKGAGTYNTATDVLVTTICFPTIGGGLGPNIIWVVTINDAKAQLAATGKQQGIVRMYGAASNDQCRTLTVTGSPTLTLWIKVNPIDSTNPVCDPVDCVPVPWRTDGDADFDNDTCTDAQELAKPGPGGFCGDDPWNPFDSNATDYNGPYYMLATARAADTCQGGSWDGQGDVPQLYNCAAQTDDRYVPGAYYHCYSYVTDKSGSLVADILCYVDFGPNTTAFPIAGVAPGPGTPLAVNLVQCAGCSGDGKPGAAPAGPTGSSAANPALFADIDTKQTHLMGIVDATNMRLWGCFQDLNGHHSTHHWTYVDIQVSRYTWQGSMRIWKNQVSTDCQNGTPFGAPGILAIEVVKQSADANRDTDQDGCPDKNELSDDPAPGGLRDPSNPWDYFNPLNNSINRTGDIQAVIQHYGHDDGTGDPLYNQKYDRTRLPGSNKWNLGPPDGFIRSNDVIAAVYSYGYDCGAGTTKVTPTPVPTRTPWVKPTPLDYVTPTP